MVYLHGFGGVTLETLLFDDIESWKKKEIKPKKVNLFGRFILSRKT